MEKKKHALYDHPFLGGIVAIIVFELVSMIFGAIVGFIGQATGTDTSIPTSIVVIITVVISLVIHRLWFKKDGYKGALTVTKYSKQDVIVCFVIAIIASFLAMLPSYIISGVAFPSFAQIASAITAGISEEIIFRAAPISIMMKNNPTRNRMIIAVIITSACFGLIHLTNIKSGASASSIIIQVVDAFAMGAFFASVYIRTGSILFSMINHSLHDLFYAFISDSSTSALVMTGSSSVKDIVTSAIFDVIVVAMAVFLLRKSKWDDIKKTWANIWSE